MTNQTTTTRPQTIDALIAFLIEATADASDDNGFVNVAKWNRSSDFGKLLDDAEAGHFIERDADRKWAVRLAGDDEELSAEPMTTAEMLEALDAMSMDVDTDGIIDFDRYADDYNNPPIGRTATLAEVQQAVDEGTMTVEQAIEAGYQVKSETVYVIPADAILAAAEPDERPVVDEDANLLHAWLTEAARKPTSDEERQAALDAAKAKSNAAKLAAKAKLAGHKLPRERKPKTTQPCHCGCGGQAKSMFLQGHDAKAKSLLLKALKDDSIEIPDVLADHVRNNPDWFARFGDLVSL